MGDDDGDRINKTVTYQRVAASYRHARAHILNPLLHGERETAAKTRRAIKYRAHVFFAPFVAARRWRTRKR